MFNKLKNRKGFTLMEMLIVVAIIAILVAIAIPTFNNAMAKSRAATDLANIRSGYAAAIVRAMTENITTYTLNADGSVDDGGTAYVCKGTSEKAADGSTIGGKFDVGKKGEQNVVGWAKGDAITFTVTAGTEDTEWVPAVTGISVK